MAPIRQDQPQSHLAFSLFLFSRPVPRPLLLGFECLALYAARLRDPFPALVNFGSQAEGSNHPVIRPHPLAGEITSRSWQGLPWSEWTPLADLPAKPGQGLYRMRLPGQERFAYIGYGHIKEGVRRRLAGSGEGYEVSWACHAGWSAYDYQSLKNDLVASHVYSLGLAPSLQFAGE